MSPSFFLILAVALVTSRSLMVVREGVVIDPIEGHNKTMINASEVDRGAGHTLTMINTSEVAGRGAGHTVTMINTSEVAGRGAGRHNKTTVNTSEVEGRGAGRHNKTTVNTSEVEGRGAGRHNKTTVSKSEVGGRGAGRHNKTMVSTSEVEGRGAGRHNKTMVSTSEVKGRVSGQNKIMINTSAVEGRGAGHNLTMISTSEVEGRASGQNKSMTNTSEVEGSHGSSHMTSWRKSQTSSDTTGTVVTCAMLLSPVGLLIVLILCCMNEHDSQPQHAHGAENASKYRQTAGGGGYSRQTPLRMSPLMSTSDNLAPQSLSALSASPPLSGYLDERGAISGLEARTLCPELIVSAPSGAIFSIPDMLLPNPQSLTLDIRDRGGAGRVVAQAVATEPSDNFIRLETSYPGPAVLAVLDTTFAFQNAAAAGTRYAILRRTFPDGRMDEMGAPFAVFFLNKSANGSILVARSGDSPGRSRPLITAILDANSKIKAVHDADQRPLAIREEARDTWNGGAAIRVQPGADAALVFCAVIAAQKLR